MMDKSISLNTSHLRRRRRLSLLTDLHALQIEDELPVIDGATALYPIYAAFAQAVYPEKEYQPYGSEVMSNRTGVAYSNLINGKVDIIFALEPSAHS